MTTILLSDAQRDTFAATGLIVIDGEPCLLQHPLECDGRHPDTIAPEEGWRILTEPCEACYGSRWPGYLPADVSLLSRAALVPGGGGQPYKRCPNSDCVGGRRVVTLTATCPTCKGDGTTCVRTAVDAYEIGACEECPAQEGDDDTGTGVVTLGRFTIPALLPVEKHRIGGWRQKAEGESWVYLYDEREATGYLDQLEFGGSIPARAIQFTMLGGLLRRVDLRLDPLPRPGQFIARPEAVEVGHAANV